MQVISLFSGIGGFELAAEAAGWQNIVSCEINDFGRRVLEYYWPDAYHHDDIHTLTKAVIDEELKKRGIEITDDIVLCGGFPCQPYSVAGKRLGKDDARHLWPQMLRLIREIKPKWVVGENVSGIVSWNDGLVFNEVYADLEAEGYSVQAVVLPAASVGAPHRRDRVWFIAYANDQRAGTGLGQVQSTDGEISQRDNDARLGDTGINTGASTGVSSNATSERPHRRQQNNEQQDDKEDGTGLVFQSERLGHDGIAANTNNDGLSSPQDRQSVGKRDDSNSPWQDNAKQPSGCAVQNGAASDTDVLSMRPITDDRSNESASGQEGQETRDAGRGSGNGNDANSVYSGLERGMHENEPKTASINAFKRHARSNEPGWENFPSQPAVRSGDDGLSSRLVGITVSRHRIESIKAYGNAIVPQVALQIFKAINKMS